MAAPAQRSVIHDDIRPNTDPEARFALLRRTEHGLGEDQVSRYPNQGAAMRTMTASPRRSSSSRRAPSCRCTSTRRWSRPTSWKARWRITRVCVVPGSSSGVPPATNTRATAPNGALILGFPQAQPLRLRRGFFTEAGER